MLFSNAWHGVLWYSLCAKTNKKRDAAVRPPCAPIFVFTAEKRKKPGGFFQQEGCAIINLKIFLRSAGELTFVSFYKTEGQLTKTL